MLLALPVDMVASGQLHDDVLRKAYPQYAHIPFEKPRGNRRDPKRLRATTQELARLLTHTYPTSLVRPTFLLPRLGVRFCSLGHGAIGSWWLSLIIYLVVLDAVANQGAVAARNVSWERAERQTVVVGE
jgi:hypothetical protein